MTGEVPRVSVCLLSYNHAAVLRETISSVLRQDFLDFELIVSDDRSRDGSWELLQRMAEEDARIRPIRPEHNLGMAANANFAVEHARAPYVALLHHDDICRADLIRRWLDAIESQPTVAFVSNAYAIADTTRVDYHEFQPVTPGRWALERQLLARLDCPVRGTAMIRREAWDAVGGMRARFGMLADIDLWMRLAARWDVGYVPEPLISVRTVRPADYPRDYVEWSWNRRRILYQIHGTNRREHYGDKGARGRLELARFRARVSLDELRWLVYAVVKRNTQMLVTSQDVDNEYEFRPVRWLRLGLQGIATRSLSAWRRPKV